MTTQEQSVPKYFSDFVQENARQHQELADRISGVETALTARISGVETSLGARITWKRPWPDALAVRKRS